MTTTRYQLLPIHALQRGRYQPRLHFEAESLQELSRSILTQGLIEPLIVREIAAQRYEIIAGERRFRAAMLAEMTMLPCLIGDYTDQQAAALTLVENIQRQELNLIEEANGYRRLCDEFHFRQDEIAALVSKSRSHIANILRLLNLCQPVQDAIIEGKLSLGHARLLVNRVASQQLVLTQQVIENEWSVRTLEEKIKTLKNEQHTPSMPGSNADIERLEINLAEQMGAPVQIVTENGRGGWLKIKFFDNDTLSGLLERMGLSYD